MKGETTLFQIDLNKSNISIPKTIFWSDVDFPKFWILEKITPPKITTKKPNNIVESSEGNIEIIFQRDHIPSLTISNFV